MQKRHVIAWMAVIATVAMMGTAALMGTANALPGTNSVDSGDIINGEVRRGDLQASAVNSAKVAANSLLSSDVKDETLTGVDIADGTVGISDLGTNSVASLELADSTVTGTDIASSTISGADVASDALTGSDILESSLNLACNTGAVHSWARIRGQAGMPAGQTSSSTYVDRVRNCSGGTVLVRRLGVGQYRIQFTGDGSVLANVSVEAGDGDNDNIVSVEKIGAEFEVIVRDVTDGSLDEGFVTIQAF